MILEYMITLFFNVSVAPALFPIITVQFLLVPTVHMGSLSPRPHYDASFLFVFFQNLMKPRLTQNFCSLFIPVSLLYYQSAPTPVTVTITDLQVWSMPHGMLHSPLSLCIRSVVCSFTHYGAICLYILFEKCLFKPLPTFQSDCSLPCY